MGEERENVTFSNGEELKASIECTYLGIKLDHSGDNTVGMKNRVTQAKQAINALNSIWWSKNITKNKKLQIHQTIVQSILTYGAEVWQIPREIKRILSTGMAVLRWSAGKSRMDKIWNKEIKERMGVQEKPDIIGII